ncbi:MAG: beta-galactosidase, partial [Bacteroidota bacterium]|nr:beta-galactosidase [Bacteroidota bacterium]
LTEWRNNGTRSSGWIKYDLSRVTEVSEVCMKLTGWRSRSYNIRILAQDGTVLWEGLTPKSLGYITLPLKKGVETRSIRIELAGSGVSKDAYSNIVEVDKNKNLDLFDSKSPDSNDPKEELRIVEIEFYESAE